MDYLPDGEAQLIPWLVNFTTKLQTHQKTLTLTDAQLKAEQDRATALVGSIQKNEQKRAEYLAQVAATRSLKEAELGRLRATVRLLKAQPTYTDAIGQDLGVIGSPATLVAKQAKPSLRIETAPGVVRLKFSKEGWSGVNVYREQADGTWSFLGTDTRSPYEDRAPLARPGQPELRKYRVTYVHKDLEVGEPSDTVTVTFAG